MTGVTGKEQASPRTILVVDDDPVVRDSIKWLLAHDGHRVQTAKSASEALALFADGRFDLVITDYAMPDTKGDALAAAIKAQAPNQKVVMLTACADVLEASDKPFASLDFVVKKPVGLKSLREILARAFPQNGSARAVHT